MKTTKWVLDAHHSELLFKVKHLMITTVTGYFKEFRVQAQTEVDQQSKFLAIVFEAEVDSISTNNEQRDEHLKSKDFMDAADFPRIIFMALEFDVLQNKLTGNLTIKDVTRTVEVSVALNGVVTDNYGQTKAGFSVIGLISRKDFGLTWNSVTDTGGVVVSDEVKFEAEIQLIKQTDVTEKVLAEVIAEL